MRHEFAAYFDPASGASSVPVKQYLQAIGAIHDAIGGMRAALAPQIATQHGWPLSDVRHALEFSIGPTKKGSLIVPFLPGATAKGAALIADDVAWMFWQDIGHELGSVRRKKACHLSANSAEGFARAAAAAKEVDATLSLATRPSRGKWTKVATLTSIESALRSHSQRRRLGHQATVELTGRITALTVEPLSFALTTGGLTQRIQLPARLRDGARLNWGGGDVVVTVEGMLSAEGDVIEPRAVNISAAATAEAAADSFDQTFGSLRDVLGSDEAREYVKQLRSH